MQNQNQSIVIQLFIKDEYVYNRSLLIKKLRFKNIIMKKLFFLVALALLILSVQSQTVALHSSTGVQIFSLNNPLNAAYLAAQDGDTLYLSGHSFSPPAVFDKKLMIFGAGHYVDSTLATGKTFITGNVILSENADMFYIEGVECTSTFEFQNNHSVNNVIVKRCKINSHFLVHGSLTSPCTNLSLIGNVFGDYLDLSNATNVFASNNLFNYIVYNTTGNQFYNNIFFNGVYSMWQHYVFTGHNNTLKNNIFLYPYGVTTGSGNIFNNNLFINATPNFGTSATALNNYVGIPQSDIFVNQTGYSFNYAHNYHLQNNSTYLGVDGTEIGIYGGAFPYKEGAVPLNPHIQFKNIAPTTDHNGNLHIQIQVEAQND